MRKNFGVRFLAMLRTELGEIQFVATTSWFVGVHANCFFAQVLLKGDFMKYSFNIVICEDTCQPICFKLGVMLNTTELYTLIQV